MDLGKEYEKSLELEWRKKEGGFYTQNYITKYMIEQTVGLFLEEHQYHFKALQNVKILDPSAGAGAFLLESLDFLLQTYQTYFPDFSNPMQWIVEHNLYAVDVDEQAVLVCRKQIFEKTGFQCPNLLVGNSLIDDPKIAGEKAFDWHKYFPEIMQHGGFDIVVGNPPYVVVKGGRFLDGYEFSKEEIKSIKKYFTTVKQQINTYILFIERFVKLLKTTGFLPFIIPNKLMICF